MAAPTYTAGSAGNGLAAATQAVGASRSFILDATNAIKAILQVGGTFASHRTQGGLAVNIYQVVGTGSVHDTVPLHTSYIVPSYGSTTQSMSVVLLTGKYSVSVQNLDMVNAVSAVYATYDLEPTDS